MPAEGTSHDPALPWLITLPGSLLALAATWFVIVPVFCADLAGRGGGTGGCGAKTPVVLLCSALFLGAAVYSGYRLIGVRLAGRAG